MSSPPAEKRIRLNLERSSSRLPHDVTDKAEEIYMREGDPAEKLTRKITKIWETAAGKFDEFTEDLATKVAIQEEEEAADAKDGQDSTQDKKRKLKARREAADAEASETRLVPRPGSTEAVDIRKEIYGRLWHAQGEIRIALDVLNIIISSYQNPGVGTSAGTGVGGSASATAAAGGAGGAAGPGGPMSNNAANTQQILPPGTLRCEYTSNTTVEASTQIQKEKMAIGGKRLQLKVARDILMQGAQKLRSVVSSEDHFWNSALRLRKNNWCIVSTNPGVGPSGGGPLMHSHHRQAPGSQLYVHYGFRDVGSTFPEQAYAEIVRVPSSGKSRHLNSIEVSIPNQTGKSVSFSLVPQGTPHTHRPWTKSEKHALASANKPKSIHAQLHDAQTSIFDAELFQEFINEARSMTYSVSIVDNEVFMPINDELELKISYRANTSATTTEPSSSVEASKDADSSSSPSHPSTIPQDAEPTSSSSSPSLPPTKHLDRTAEILKCCMRLAQHKRHRQNIHDKRDSFFKRSRPGAALAGSGGPGTGATAAGGSAAGGAAGGGAGGGASAATGANAGAAAAATAVDGGAVSVVGGGAGGATGGAGGADATMVTVAGSGGAAGGSAGAGGAGGAGNAAAAAAAGGAGANSSGGAAGHGGHLVASPLMLDATLHLLQYYSFARRIREVVDRVTRPFRLAWWEPLELHTWDMKKPPVAAASANGSLSSSSVDGAGPSRMSRASSNAITATMGTAVAIRLGAHTPALRFVIRSHPTPCVVLQLADRPSWPIKHAAEFEQVLRQELAVRAVGRLCQVANAIEDWTAGTRTATSSQLPSPSPPKWVIDIERQCVGVFKTAGGGSGGASKTTTKLVILQLETISGDSSHEGTSQAGELGLRMKFSVQKSSSTTPSAGGGGAAGSEPTKWVRHVSLQECLAALGFVRTEEAFKAWLARSIAQELDL